MEFAFKTPTRPVRLCICIERILKLGRVKRGPGKGRMRTIKRYAGYTSKHSHNASDIHDFEQIQSLVNETNS